MKAKVVRGDNFESCLEYVTKKEGAYCIGGSVIGGDGRMMAKEFLATIPPQRRNIKKPVWHCSLSLPKGEKLSNDEWMNIVNSYMGKMNISPKNRAYSVIRHNDTNYDHIHFVVSRVDIDGNLWSNENDVYKSLDATQKLEKEHGLQQTKGYNRGANKAEKTPSYKETERTLRTGEITCKKVIQNAIKETTRQSCRWGEFKENLSLQGIEIQLHIHANTKKVYGISYKVGDVAVKGSKLGKSYTLKGLKKKGLDYDQSRESEEHRTKGHQGEAATYGEVKQSGESNLSSNKGISKTTTGNSRSNSGENSSVMVSGGEAQEIPSIKKTPREPSRRDREAQRHVKTIENKSNTTATFGGFFRGNLQELDRLRSESMDKTQSPNIRARVERIEREKKKELERQRKKAEAARKAAEKAKIERIEREKKKEELEQQRKKAEAKRAERRKREAERGVMER